MNLRPLLFWANRLLWTLLVCAVLGAGVVVSLARHYVGYIDRYQDEIAAALERRSGLKVSIGSLNGRWQRLAPQLEVTGLRFYNPADPHEPVVALERLTLRLGLFHSLHEGTLVFHRVAGSGLRLHLDEVALGQWRLRGLPEGGERNPDALIDMLLAIHRARIDDSHIALRFFDGGGTYLDGALTLERSRRFRRLGLDVRVASGAPIRLTVEAQGDPRRQRGFRADAYAEFTDIDLSPLLPAAQAFGVDLTHGRLDGRAWLSWRDGALRVRGQLAAPEIDLAALTGRRAPPLTDFHTDFLLEQRAGRRQLWLPRVHALWDGHTVDLRQLLLSQSADEPGRFRAALPQLELAPLGELLLGDGLLPATLRDALATLAPAGELQRLHLVLPTAPERSELFSLRGELHAISLQPWHGAPGAEGVSGYLELGSGGGSALLESGDLRLSLPRVYHQPLQFDRARGAVRWQLEPERVRLQSGAIELAGDAGNASAQLVLDLPRHHDEAHPPLMTLLVGMRDSDARFRDRFIPHFLNPGLLQWLERSIQGGRLREGGFLYRGSLRGGDTLNRTVQLHLAVAEGALAYQPEWPALRDAEAELWLDDARLQVELARARMLERIELASVRVAMAPAAGRGNWLTVAGNARGEGDDLLQLLRATPLRRQLGAALDGWRWRGGASARVELGIPIGSGRPVAIGIEGQLEEGTLTLGDLGLEVARLRGPLNYSSDGGLQSPGVTGALYGQPLTLKAATTQGTLRLDIDGRVAMAELQRHHPHSLLSHASGAAGFTATLTVDGQRSWLSGSFDLRGVRVDLPAPYAKAVAEPLPLRVEMALGGARTLRATLGEWAELALFWTEQGALYNGTLRLGRTGSVSAAPGELAIGGHLPPLGLDAWRDGPLRFTDAGGEALAGGLTPVLRDLYCPELTIGDLQLRDLQLSGRRLAEGWQLQARADRFAGELLLPSLPERPWLLHLRELRLPAPQPAAGPADWLASVEPASVPAADVRIDALWRGDQNWGSLAFLLRPQADGLRLEQLQGTLRDIRIGARDDAAAVLTWQRRSGVDSSRFDGRLAVDNLGRVLEHWQYERVVVTRSGQLDAGIAWSGRPDQFALGLLDGEAALTLQDGRFLKAGASAEGALKVVGIFNFANLLRRLQLDFSDLFRDGISFDHIDGRFSVRRGVIDLTEPLAIRGPSSRFRMQGQLDFNTDQVDMELTATLPLAGNLPWLAALAGGLPAAAGVYLASKLFGDEVDRFSSAVYDVTGPWREPAVRFRRFFDDRLEARTPPQSGVNDGG